MFKLMGMELNAILGAQTILIWTYGSCDRPEKGKHQTFFAAILVDL